MGINTLQCKVCRVLKKVEKHSSRSSHSKIVSKLNFFTKPDIFIDIVN